MLFSAIQNLLLPVFPFASFIMVYRILNYSASCQFQKALLVWDTNCISCNLLGLGFDWFVSLLCPCKQFFMLCLIANGTTIFHLGTADLNMKNEQYSLCIVKWCRLILRHCFLKGWCTSACMARIPNSCTIHHISEALGLQHLHSVCVALVIFLRNVNTAGTWRQLRLYPCATFCFAISHHTGRNDWVIN